jgi:hypothetical protein
MRLAAVLVPVALFCMPTLLFVAYATVKGLRGGLDTGNRPVTKAQVRIGVLAVCAYVVLVFASIGWPIYEFTGSAFFVLLYGLCLVLFVGLVAFMARMTPALPAPPPEGFQDAKARLDWLNKRADIQAIRSTKMLFSWKYWALVFLIALAFAVTIAVVGSMLD